MLACHLKAKFKERTARTLEVVKLLENRFIRVADQRFLRLWRKRFKESAMSQKAPQFSMRFLSEAWHSGHRLCWKHQINSTCWLKPWQALLLWEKMCEVQCRQGTQCHSLSLMAQLWGSLTCLKVRQLVSPRKSTPSKTALSCSSQDSPSMSCEVKHLLVLPNLLKRETISKQTNLSQRIRRIRVTSIANVTE